MATAYQRCVGRELRGTHGGPAALKRASRTCREHTAAGRTRRGRRHRSR